MCLWESKKDFRKALAMKGAGSVCVGNSSLVFQCFGQMCDLLFVFFGRKQAQPWTCISLLERPARGLSQPTTASAAATDPAVLTRGFQLWQMCPVPCLTPAPLRMEE